MHFIFFLLCRSVLDCYEETEMNTLEILSSAAVSSGALAELSDNL